MRFFIGSSSSLGGNKKKKSASEIFKRKLQGKVEFELTPEEKYKKILDDKVAKLTEEVLLGKKKGFKLPGTKQDDDSAPQELTKTQKEMLQILAQRKLEKERKFEKKKEKQALEAQKLAKKAKAQMLAAQNAQQPAQQSPQQNLVHHAATQVSHYFFGHDHDDHH